MSAKWFVRTFFAVLLLISNLQYVYAHDTSGIHAFFNDDKNQFVDFWLNQDGNITIKVSNGRQWRPMWVVAHANFMSGNQLLTRIDYHVYCQSPIPGGHGAETWFRFAGPGVSGVSSIVLTTNKGAPWGKPSGGWEVMISVPIPVNTRN
jgi:hypothetical protein